MSRFERGQSAMMAALDLGPSHLPGDLFTGDPERVLAGMMVHANTISHARLVALEDTFPRTLAYLGHAAFNQLSRQFLDQPGTASMALGQIGDGFDAFLAEQGEASGVADLARFEWHWLSAYHAADAGPLSLGALAGLAPEDLLDVMLCAHPAARAGRYAPLVHDVLGREVPGLAAADAILVTRPGAEVLVAPATAPMADIFALAQKPSTIGNLLGAGCEPAIDEAAQIDASMQALLALINAGALVRA